ITTPRRPPPPTLFPYTTLFRSQRVSGVLTEAVDEVEDTAGEPGLLEDAGPQRRREGSELRGLEDHRVAGGQRRAQLPGLEHEGRSEEHTSELQSRENLVCRLLL